jgi:hypothetical protein
VLALVREEEDGGGYAVVTHAFFAVLLSWNHSFCAVLMEVRWRIFSHYKF